MNNALISFENKGIRKIWYDEQWYFSVVDVIAVLTDSVKPRDYWSVLKKREPQLPTNCRQLKLKSNDGKSYQTDCATTEGIFRIIMSVPSSKAEPLKLWLAEQGKRTIDETENPELLTQRQIDLYKAKGYTDEWIEKRSEATKARIRLTGEWQKRGVTENKDYSILTAVIAKGTFGVTPSEHAKVKGLEKQNLRDHMTPLELIFTALGEESTRLLSINKDANGFNENYEAASEGGIITGEARENYEKRMGLKVVSKDNFLPQSKGDKIEELPPNE